MEKGEIQEGLLADMLPDSLMEFPTTKLMGETTITNYIFNNQGNQAKNQIQGIDMRASKLADEMLSGSLMEFPTTKLVGETTAERNLKKIEDCLLRDEVRKIGVYGMGGVGKTTIMTHIYNKMIKNKGKFDNVIWVTVSNETNLEELQDRVLKALRVKGSEYKDALCRSAEIHGYFKKRGKFLLIMDDVWSIISLTEVGIPEPNEENKCKIVWTTRNNKVCRGMGSEMTVKVDCLTTDESWTLFNEKLGDTLICSPPEIKKTAKDVADKCGGLPLAIITVGAAMKGVDNISIWSNALRELENSRTEHEGLEGVFPCLRFSFDRLKTQRLQDCFLYCALYPEDFAIDCGELIENWMEEEFFYEIEDRENAFNKGYTMLNDLKEACMLEGVQANRDDDCVKMHDLLRELAISVTCEGEKSRFFVKTGVGMVQFPMDKKLMEDVERISLMSGSIKGLSCQPNCPKLSTLFLGGQLLSDNFDPLFFARMQNLRVLDLSLTPISLPQSLSSLVKLRALHLRACYHLKEVPSVEKLGELRVLNLPWTSIKCLPEGMNGLTNLRRLDLCSTIELEMFPAGLLSNFSRLEELLMLDSAWSWSRSTIEGGAGVEEIARLAHLRKLLVMMTDITTLSYYVRYGNWRDLTCFIIDVRNSPNKSFRLLTRDLSGDRSVTFFSSSECMSSLLVPKSTQTLQFNDCDNIPSLSEIPCIRRLDQLESCRVSSCREMEYIVTQTENSFLPNLSRLEIHSMYKLRTICKEPTQGTNLANLKWIIIYSCPNLKYVFSVGWLQSLQYLEEITVAHCKAMEEMVVELEDTVEANNNQITITLPTLKKLELTDLKQLQSISKRTLICNSLETFKVWRCEQLKKLPLSIESIPPSLKQMHVYPMKWWKSLEWDNPGTKSRLKPFLKKALEDEGEQDDDDDDDDGGGGYATAEEGEKDEDDDDDDGGGYATAEEGEKDEDDDNDHKKDAAADDNEEERHGTKRKADRAGLTTWIFSYFIVCFFVFVFLSWKLCIWFDLTYGIIEDVPPPT